MTPKKIKELQREVASAHHDYEKGLNVHAFFKVHDRPMSQDLVQDTFTKTWLYLVKGGKIEIMRAFLYHVLNNLIIDQYRKHKTTSLDDLLDKGFEPGEDESEHLFNVMDGKKATQLIKRLPEKYKHVMHMKYIKILSLEEISVITKQSKNAIAVQLHRGLIKLKLLYDTNKLD